jgi:hypothetical protein
MPVATTDLQVVQVPIDDLSPDPANPRKISDAELDSLTRGTALVTRPCDTRFTRV